MYRILIVEDDAGIAEAVSEHVSCDEQIGAWTSNRSSPAGLEHRKKSHPSDDSFFYLFESTRRRRTSGGQIGRASCRERV